GVNMLISKPLFKSSLSSAFEKIYSGKDNLSRSTSAVEYDFSGKRILLVEDHLLNIEVAKNLLNAKNLKVDVAENGLRAIEVFAQKEVGYYDAILMDIRMPIMDGITATKSIRQMLKSDAKTIPIIAMTANAFDEDIEKTKLAGMNAHIAKPIEPSLLYQTLQDFFEKGENS
ncbi:MAG: response regulator, partial [Clostridia bacterium]